MDEYKKKQLINAMTRAAVKYFMDMAKDKVKTAIQNNRVLNELFKQRG